MKFYKKVVIAAVLAAFAVIGAVCVYAVVSSPELYAQRQTNDVKTYAHKTAYNKTADKKGLCLLR